MSDAVHPLKLVSLLLQYPGGELLGARADLCDAAAELRDGPQGDAVRRFTTWYRQVPGDELQALGLEPEGHSTSPPARYTEASLVQALEELGIGLRGRRFGRRLTSRPRRAASGRYWTRPIPRS